MAVDCEICGSPVARWQNMPGHYRRAHPDVVLPDAIARFGLQHSPRRLRGRETQRALPQPGHRDQPRPAQRALPRPGQRDLPQPGYRARPRIQRGLVGSEARYVASLPGASERHFRSILDDDPVPVKPSVAAPVEKKVAFGGWLPWVLVAGVALFLILGGLDEIGSSEGARSNVQGNKRLVSNYQPEGAGQ